MAGSHGKIVIGTLMAMAVAMAVVVAMAVTVTVTVIVAMGAHRGYARQARA